MKVPLSTQNMRDPNRKFGQLLELSLDKDACMTNTQLSEGSEAEMKRFQIKTQKYVSVDAAAKPLRRKVLVKPAKGTNGQYTMDMGTQECNDTPAIELCREAIYEQEGESKMHGTVRFDSNSDVSGNIEEE